MTATLKKSTKIWLIIVVCAVIAIASIPIIDRDKPLSNCEYAFWNNAKPLETGAVVRIMVNWYHEAEFCGYYFAKTEGFYRDFNLDTRILPYDPEKSALDNLREGKIDFAITTPTDIALEDCENSDIVAIGAIFQLFPAVFITMDGSGLDSPMDFCGKTIIAKNQTWIIMTQHAIENAGGDSSCVEWDTGKVDITRFLRGEVDIWLGYIHDEPVEVAMAGYSGSMIYYFDYGLNDYASIIMTRRDLVENQPDLVLAFLAATLRGWNSAFHNQEDALESVMIYAPGLAVPFQREAIKTLIPFVRSGSAPIGWIDSNRWCESLSQWGIEHPESFLDDSFLQELYKDNYALTNVFMD